MMRVLGSPLLAAFLALSPCNAREQVGSHASAQATPVAAQAQPRSPAAAENRAAEPPGDVPVVLKARPLVRPITADMVAAMRVIRVRDPALRDDVFAKMGGSSVVNRGFLHCFDEEPTVDFGGRPLDDTLSFFRSARIGTRSPFARTSLAAAVGWSIRHAMGGRPPYVVQELRATNARFALAFFGSNDVEGKNAHQFAGRLDRLVTTLAERGVVPILGATYPRRANDPDMNEQVRRYNRMSYALAIAHGLPYVDFHQAMLPLPGRGLAGDGYHPNTYLVGPRAHACDFGPQGLAYGNNQRNLLTMTALDAVRRTVLSDEPTPAPEHPRVGEGTPVAPLHALELPFAHRVALEAMPPEETELAAGCAGTEGSARRVVVRFTLDSPLRVRASAVAMGPTETHLGIRRVADGHCYGRGEDEEVLALEAGTYELSAYAARMRRPPEDQANAEMRMLVVLDAEPTSR